MPSASRNRDRLDPVLSGHQIGRVRVPVVGANAGDPSLAVGILVQQRRPPGDGVVHLDDLTGNGVGNGPDPLAALRRGEALAFRHLLAGRLERDRHERLRQVLSDIGEPDGHDVAVAPGPHVLLHEVVEIVGDVAAANGGHGDVASSCSAIRWLTSMSKATSRISRWNSSMNAGSRERG